METGGEKIGGRRGKLMTREEGWGTRETEDRKYKTRGSILNPKLLVTVFERNLSGVIHN